MRVAYLGGGTGGHLAPGIGVAEALGGEEHETLFLVAGRGVERAMLEPRRLRFVELFGDRGRPPPWRIDLWVRATRRLTRALNQFDPEVLVVLGGWVALPALWVSALPNCPRRPTVLVEPNAIPGKVGRWLDRRVDFACLARAGAAMPRGREATTVTGVPGPALKSWSRAAAAARFGLSPDARTLLVTGGSQGARDVNRLVPPLIDLLALQDEPWQVLHITGPGGDPVEGSAAVPVVATVFVDDMSPAWALADLALCRAGSGTCCELQASGTPAVVIPYPHHRDHHQEANAAALVEQGAALLVGREDPTGAKTTVGLVSRALGSLVAMTEAARGSSPSDPARSVAAVVRRAARGHRSPTVLAGGLPRRVHCVGVAGGGLSALAGLLASRGHQLSGSDSHTPPEALSELGVQLHQGHAAEHLGQAELLIRSAAIPDSNVEVRAARSAGIPVLKYSEALGRLMATRRGLAVAGTHGKTSTTAMAAHLLAAAGAQPAWIIGGKPHGMAPFAWGHEGPMVVEACEYDRSFLNLTYDVALITGIAVDHLDCFGDFEGVCAAFGEFCAGLSVGGRLVLGPGVARQLGSRLSTDTSVVSVDEVLPLRSARPVKGGWQATMGPSGEHEVLLRVMGRHDLDNLRCALVAASCCGVPMAELLPGVSSYGGVARRLQDLGEVALKEGGRAQIVDDFAHHPDALEAALLAARSQAPGRRVVAVFQPHQVCRTEDMLESFAEVLKGFDEVLLCDIFSARDAHPERADDVCEALSQALGPRAVRLGAARSVDSRVLERLRPDDLCLVMGAGDIDGLAQRLVGAAPRS